MLHTHVSYLPHALVGVEAPQRYTLSPSLADARGRSAARLRAPGAALLTSCLRQGARGRRDLAAAARRKGRVVACGPCARAKCSLFDVLGIARRAELLRAQLKRHAHGLPPVGGARLPRTASSTPWRKRCQRLPLARRLGPSPCSSSPCNPQSNGDQSPSGRKLAQWHRIRLVTASGPL